MQRENNIVYLPLNDPPLLWSSSAFLNPPDQQGAVLKQLSPICIEQDKC